MSRCNIVKVGCCGFALAQKDYFRAFNCVEINSSFYQLPKRETAAKWRASAPNGFEFAMKAWQVITHRAGSPTYKRTGLDPKLLRDCGDFRWNATVRWAWDGTRAVANELRAFLVLFQCPGSFRPTAQHIENLRTFFAKAERGKFLLGWEPRGQWDAKLVASLCTELGLIHVVDPFQGLPAVEGQIRYFRLHGITGYGHRFSDAELRRLHEFCAGDTPVYCFFNNVTMAEDALRFARMW